MDILRRNTDYALRMMVELAKNDSHTTTVSVRTLSQTTQVPYQLACKLMQRLQGAGLVCSEMGPKGGFRLKSPASDISTLAVIEAIQGPVSLNRCLLSEGNCLRREGCPVRIRLEGLQETMDGYLREVTLQELVATPCGSQPPQAPL